MSVEADRTDGTADIDPGKRAQVATRINTLAAIQRWRMEL
jgi:hypothetical protein